MKIARGVATLGPIGYCKGSGTIASICTALCIAMFKDWLRPCYAYLAIVITLVSYLIIARTLDEFQQDDPSEIVIDEVAGCFVSFLGAALTNTNIIAGLLLFRFFDITKLWPIGACEKLKGAGGVLLDDIVAGLLTAFMLSIWRFLCIY